MSKIDPTAVHCKEHPDAPLLEDYRAGDQICSECGLVVGDRVIDVGSEWRTFSNEKAWADPSRVEGPENPLLHHGSDVATSIGGRRGEPVFDEFGVAKYQNRKRKSISSVDSTLMNAVNEINQMADRINLPRTVVDRANKRLKKMVYDGKNLKGRSNDALASASLHIACHQEISTISKSSKEEILRCCKLMLDTSAELINTGQNRALITKAGADPSGVGELENPRLNGSDLTTSTTITGGGMGEAAFDEFGVAKYQNRKRKSISSADRTLMNVFKRIKKMADQINIPATVVDHANDLFQVVRDGKNLKGRSNDAIASTCLYIECRQERDPRTFIEISAVSKISEKEIQRCYKIISTDISVKPNLPEYFVPRFCKDLSLPSDVQEAATAIAKTAVALDIGGATAMRPNSVAAVAIYIASQASEVKRSEE